MKRFIATLLCIALCLPMLACSGSAAAQQRVSARTTLAGSEQAKRRNIEIAAASMNGITVPSGVSFSFNNIVGPRTKAYGFQSAPNGRGSRVVGGGVAQAASTLYLALKQLNQDIEYTSLRSYGAKFSDNYVSSGADAILVDYNAGTDFSFINWGDDFTIEMWTTESYLYCALTTGDAAFEQNFMNWQPATPARQPIASATIWLDGTDAMKNNVRLAADSINDTVLSSGDLFSFNNTVGPRVQKYGYQSALNGRGVKVTGGGVAQVASVIWMAVKNLDCVGIVEKSTYGKKYNQHYVSSSNDAILTDYSDHIDFSFRNTGHAPLTISTYVSGDMLCCNIYQN